MSEHGHDGHHTIFGFDRYNFNF
ncbi:uncharacterized protein METZ01_LOCUS430672, partial [marine metagenome]